MFKRTLILALSLCSLNLVSANALAPRASNTPVPCIYSCPLTDTAGNPLIFTEPNGNPIFCVYPNEIEGACFYDQTTGSLVEDDDLGDCPSTALSTCPTRRRGVPRREVKSETTPAAYMVDIRRFRKSKAQDKMAVSSN